MKLGKKAVSCLLAIMMIVTSVSVCFTVLGADASTQARSLLNTITNVYDDLKNGWDLAHAAEPDTSRVPAVDAGTVWKVEVDGYHSGWMQTAQAFCYFREMTADIAVIECGMGGRDDATNVIPVPLVCVFAPISLDHVNILGKDISGIASVKAGIIKPGSRVVSAHQDEAAYKELKKACDKTGSSLTIADEPVNIRFSLREQSFDCGGYKGLKTGLKGVFQPDNAALALAAVKALNEAGIEISEEAVRRGLKEAQWPGRFEIIKKKPYIIIDGAHNEAAAYELERSIREYFKDAKFIGVAGVLKDKDYPKVLKIMMPHIDQLITLTPPDNPRALPAMELAEEAMKYTNRITVADSVEEAYEIAGLLSGGKEDILAFGSLSWLGRFKAEAGKKENKNGRRK